MRNAHGLVVGVFDHQAPAELAVADLWTAGFARDRIDMVTRSQGQTQGTPDLTRQKDAATGAGPGGGAVAGAVAGAVLTLLVPGIGTVLGGGLLAGIVGGAALGAAGGTFLGPFVALEIDEETAGHYARHVDEGGALVLVQAGERADEARAILARHGAREGGLTSPPAMPAVVVPGRA
jgi:hypothetical protein